MPNPEIMILIIFILSEIAPDKTDERTKAMKYMLIIFPDDVNAIFKEVDIKKSDEARELTLAAKIARPANDEYIKNLLFFMQIPTIIVSKIAKV